MLLIAMIIGAVLGGVWAGTYGMASGALLGWLWARSQQQARDIAVLRQALAQTHAHTQAGTPPVAASVPTTPSPAPAYEAELPPIAPAAMEPPSPEPLAHAVSELDSLPSAVPAPQTPPPAWVQTLRGWVLGGNTIAKAGVAILFTGLAFLAKYASEQIDVPVELRLTGIGAAALALMVVGWRLRQRRAGYAQVLQGGAVAVLYLTLFVAFRFYGVLGAGPVFVAMACVAALAAALAVLQNARALAVIGALGGFATPLLVATGGGNQVALFSYYLLLDLGIAAVAWHRTWRLLNLIGFLFTFAVGSAWGVMRYQPDDLLSSQAFLIAYFLLFNAIALMPARRRADGSRVATLPGDGWVNGSMLFGLPTITFALQHGLVGHLPYGTALSALALAAFYVLLALWLRRHAALALPFEACLAVATVFLTLVIPFALDARSTAGAWALEGAGLVWLGWRQARRLPRAFGYALQLFAGLAMQWAVALHGASTALFDAYLFNALMLAAGALIAARCVQRHAAGESAGGLLPGEATAAQALLIAWGTFWLLAAAGMHIDALVPAPLWLAAWLVCLSAIALLHTALATRLDWPLLTRPLLAHAPLLALGLAYSALAQASPAAQGGAWAWPAALATHAVVLWHAAPRWPARWQHAVHALGAVVLAGLGALQGRALTADWSPADSAWAWLGWGVVPALLLALLLRPRAANVWPVRALPAAYTGSAAAVLTACLLLWTLLANLASPGDAAPLPYLPLANPLDLGIAAALLASAAGLRSAPARAALATRPGTAATLLAVACFVWLNAMLIRAFHHFGGVPFEVDAWLQSRAVHSGIALLWAVTALVLMWWATRRHQRAPWLAGAGLLAAVVLKLVWVDLSGSGTVARIVSFIGVGVLMLVIGYIAPLPAKEAPRHAPV